MTEWKIVGARTSLVVWGMYLTTIPAATIVVVFGALGIFGFMWSGEFDLGPFDPWFGASFLALVFWMLLGKWLYRKARERDEATPVASLA